MLVQSNRSCAMNYTEMVSLLESLRMARGAKPPLHHAWTHSAVLYCAVPLHLSKCFKKNKMDSM